MSDLAARVHDKVHFDIVKRFHDVSLFDEVIYSIYLATLEIERKSNKLKLATVQAIWRFSDRRLYRLRKSRIDN